MKEVPLEGTYRSVDPNHVIGGLNFPVGFKCLRPTWRLGVEAYLLVGVAHNAGPVRETICRVRSPAQSLVVLKSPSPSGLIDLPPGLLLYYLPQRVQIPNY